MSLVPGTPLGPYEVVAAIGAGGMGEVYPNIAQIYGLGGSDEGAPSFIMMELVEGDDLAQRIAPGALPITEARPIARQMADPLDAAHGRGIIQRDLKPTNIKVRPDGTEDSRFWPGERVGGIELGWGREVAVADADADDAGHDDRPV